MTEFGRNRSQEDGLERRCRDCRREASHRDYMEHHEERLAQHAQWRNQNPEYQLDWQHAHPEQMHGYNVRWSARNHGRMVVPYRVYARVQQALRDGVLSRPEQCEQCGATGRIEAAHADYTRPLDVRWLCVTCHRRWDRLQPKTATV